MKWLSTMLTDGCDGTLSSRRVITFLAFIICSVSFLFDQFTLHSAKPELFDSMVYLVIAGLGFTVI
jgi:hypothetical protein